MRRVGDKGVAPTRNGPDDVGAAVDPKRCAADAWCHAVQLQSFDGESWGLHGVAGCHYGRRWLFSWRRPTRGASVPDVGCPASD